MNSHCLAQTKKKELIESKFQAVGIWRSTAMLRGKGQELTRKCSRKSGILICPPNKIKADFEFPQAAILESNAYILSIT